MSNAKDKIQWHSAFYSAMQMELEMDAERLIFYTEYGLTKKPLEMDMLIISKENDVEINNSIGHLFKKFNIIEYKSPDDKLNIDVLYKTFAYACLYKISGETVNKRKAKDITITIIRENIPKKLFKDLEDEGYFIEEKYRGIYYVKGGLFDVQIIVTRLLNPKDHIWFSVLTRELDIDIFEDLLKNAELVQGKRNEEHTDAILSVVLNVNRDKIEVWKEENSMRYPSLAIIMQPELQQSREEGKTEGRVEGVIETMLKFGKTVPEISEEVHLSEEEVNRIIEHSMKGMAI